MSVSTGSAVVRGDDPTHRGPVGPGRIQRQPLAVFCEPGVHVRQTGTRLDGGGQIAMAVLHHGVEPRRRHHQVDRLRNAPPLELGAPTANEDG